MDTMETVTQPERERLNAFVLPETVQRVKVWSTVNRQTLGELIDDLVMRYVPPVPAPIAADSGK